MKNTFLLAFLFLLSLSINAQNTLSGTVSDGSQTLIGATVQVDGSDQGAITDIDGKYALSLADGTYTITVSYTGYEALSQSVTLSGSDMTLDFSLKSGLVYSELIVTGTRASNRTDMESAVPVDVIDVSALSVTAPQTDVNQLLHATTPSFSSNTQTISDGTDHIDPAALRGLGPDQVLVLINGKRRHTTSLVNVNGTFGRGNVGTDLNAIPASAIERIEVLRDGAAAQYGSDAIAGVINIKLKETTNKLNLNLTTGANFTEAIGPFGGETKSYDGEVIKLSANYGLDLMKNGYINFTGELGVRGSTNRMQEFQGGIFNRLNAIERLAAADGLDVNTLSLSEIQAYGQDVAYFDAETQSALAGLTSMDGLADILGEDERLHNPLRVYPCERTIPLLFAHHSKDRKQIPIQD